MSTLLAKRQNQAPITTTDTHHDILASDPDVPEIPQNSTFGSHVTSRTTAVSMSNARTADFTKAGDNAGQNAEILVKHSKESADWINTKWRPAMGWVYMVVCIFDFILFPIMFTGVQFYETEAVNDAFRQWEPITLAGAGLFHMAMGAVLGITAYGRTKEKIVDKS